MGLKHVNLIIRHMMENPGKGFSRAKLREDLGIYFWEVDRCLKFLHEKGMVRCRNSNGIKRYEWGGNSEKTACQYQ